MRKFIIWIALAFDSLFGDPPNRFHPVAWIGHSIKQIEVHLPYQNPTLAFLEGLAVWISGSSLIFTLAGVVGRVCSLLPFPLNFLGEAYLLKMTLAYRGLSSAATQIATVLPENLSEGRRLLAWHLVSRETSELSTVQVAAATIESVAENTSDGIIAPLFYYALGGLPLAWLYRFSNTLDSMWGYHSDHFEWLGKAAAKIDDILNYIPARLTAFLIVISAWMNGEHALQAWHVIKRDAQSTASPNAGYPMSAMAGALGVELEKVGSYRLGKDLPSPEVKDIKRSLAIMRGAVLIGVTAITIFSWL
ncbi:MAG: adenosylcobinamide-phosphate synthase CbiB, partial [Anaerolineales bacterium]